MRVFDKVDHLRILDRSPVSRFPVGRFPVMLPKLLAFVELEGGGGGVVGVVGPKPLKIDDSYAMFR
jgi:hypothetical protein